MTRYVIGPDVALSLSDREAVIPDEHQLVARTPLRSLFGRDPVRMFGCFGPLTVWVVAVASAQKVVVDPMAITVYSMFAWCGCPGPRSHAAKVEPDMLRVITAEEGTPAKPLGSRRLALCNQPTFTPTRPPPADSDRRGATNFSCSQAPSPTSFSTTTRSPPTKSSIGQMSAAGRVTLKVAPVPGPSLWAVTRPRCSWTSARTMARPIPDPPRSRSRAASAR